MRGYLFDIYGNVRLVISKGKAVTFHFFQSPKRVEDVLEVILEVINIDYKWILSMACH